MIASLTNTLSGGVERSLMTIGGLVGAAFSFAFGDVAPLMLWLAIFIIVDMMTCVVSILIGIREANKIVQALAYRNDSVTVTF